MSATARAAIAMPTFAPTDRPLDFLLEGETGVALAEEELVLAALDGDMVVVAAAVLLVAVDVTPLPPAGADAELAVGVASEADDVGPIRRMDVFVVVIVKSRLDVEELCRRCFSPAIRIIALEGLIDHFQHLRVRFDHFQHFQ